METATTLIPDQTFPEIIDIDDILSAPHDIDFPAFRLNQNTQDTDLRALREEYPRIIFREDFQRSYIEALRPARQDIKNSINRYRRTLAAQAALKATASRHTNYLAEIFAGLLSTNELRAALSNTNLKDTSIYRQVISNIEEYRGFRASYNHNRREYAGLQAQYTQRAAMIRQRPRITIDLDVYHIFETLLSWDHVWGLNARTASSEDYFYLRVGLCDIVMEDSAVESRYDYPAAIRLAPFYFTLRLSANGQQVCSSHDYNAVGLSRQNGGERYYDFHPHQLSDTPCFGTFGQTIVDLAGQGDIISLISTIIAFYSQYNSQDSAGVEARNYHPANLYCIRDKEEYETILGEEMSAFGNCGVIKTDKLQSAIDAYLAYHEAERNVAPPERIDYRYCSYCNDVVVGDDDEYYISAADERICPDCWNEHYCHDCERYCEDCQCDPEE